MAEMSLKEESRIIQPYMNALKLLDIYTYLNASFRSTADKKDMQIVLILWLSWFVMATTRNNLQAMLTRSQ